MNIQTKQRRFVFQGKTLNDLNLSVVQTKNHYMSRHPELMNAEVKQTENEEELRIEFVPKFAQKG